MSESQVDLRKLAFDRKSQHAGGEKKRRRYWASRYFIPGGILVGFVALLGAAAGHQLLPRQRVTVVPVIMQRSEVQRAGTALFQAAGWIEPSPTPVSVAALAPGVIEELLVVEGEQVVKGQPIARLIAIDSELAVEQAKATLAIRAAELQRAQAEHKAAVTRVEKPVHLEAQLAEAESVLAKSTTGLQKLPFLIRAAMAKVAFTRSSLEGKQSAQAAIAGVVVARAAKDHAEAQAELEELQQRGPNLEREIDALQKKANALSEQRSLLVEERRQAEESLAKVVSALALRDEAKLRIRQAELALRRAVVRAPMDGRILRLVCLPGTRVMGLHGTDGQSSSTVVQMYDPQRLQVRADVRLEDVPTVTPGAPVEIETASFGKVIRGRVLQLTSSANIQKNTLEVKVELIDPPATVSPDMLVAAKFLSPELPKPATEPAETERLFAPEQLVRTGDGGAVIWCVNTDSRATPKNVVLGRARLEGLVEIVEGLTATDKLIASGVENLRAGTTVVISGEDLSIGMRR